jgi:formiminotetrahydrofolate cyclodeaminase
VSVTPAALSAVAEQLALASPPDGAGVLAAGVAELAAGLCESVARDSLDHWSEGAGAAMQAATLRSRSGAAAAANAHAYTVARAALAQEPGHGIAGRDAALRAVLVRAADTLLMIGAAGADCAALAAEIAARCRPGLRADAAAAAELAVAVVRSAAALLDINLALLPGDERRERASEMIASAEASRTLARAAVGAG